MEREDALRLIQGSSRREHSLLVSRIMVVLPYALGETVSDRGLAGLLPDLDERALAEDDQLVKYIVYMIRNQRAAKQHET